MESIPEELRSLLDNRISAYDELEIVLLLAGHPARWFTASSVADRFDLADETAENALGQLCANGLAQQSRGGGGSVYYRYWPRHQRLRRTIELLEREYRDNPAAVVLQVSTNAIDRARMSLLRTFAKGLLTRGDSADHQEVPKRPGPRSRD
jgi:hypothetical protein